MNKYKLLWEYIKDKDSDIIKLSYDDIKKILGFDIDHSFLTYKKQLIEYGFEASKISIKEKYIIFKRISN